MSVHPIRVEVPVCAFRPYVSREYQDTFPVPSPSAVYGMLLSLLGVPREGKARHRGAELALGIPEMPGLAKVFRKLRRGKDLENTRPDYQDLLIDLTMWVWLRPGTDAAEPPLCEGVSTLLRPPHAVTREGAVSLGESSYLVDVVAIDPNPPEQLRFVLPDPEGFFSLPVWVDHTDWAKSVTNRFRITDPISVADTLPSAWIRIGG
jgi:CRISPR-associated protein Cas5t